MRSSTGMIDLALFLALLGICLTVAFTAVKYTELEVYNMHNKEDVRQIQQVAAGGLNHTHLSRPGGYLDAHRLAFSLSTASADSRATINFLGTEIEPYDMYVMNAGETAQWVPILYDSIKVWWDGFRASKEYTDSYGNICLGPVDCPNAKNNTYDFSKPSEHKRTFTPRHIVPSISGYELPNPTSLDEARFKMLLVETGTDAYGDAKMEYRVYIFLGSLVKLTPTSAPTIEYRWYECVEGSATHPWIVMQ